MKNQRTFTVLSGVVFAFALLAGCGEEKKPTPPPVVAAAPTPAPAPAKCADTDADGVCDADDQCPDTMAGTRVGPVGCNCDYTLQTHFANDSANLVDAADKAYRAWRVGAGPHEGDLGPFHPV